MVQPVKLLSLRKSFRTHVIVEEEEVVEEGIQEMHAIIQFTIFC
jgi:hypothetical protein